jgi:chromosome segregation ATPase
MTHDDHLPIIQRIESLEAARVRAENATEEAIRRAAIAETQIHHLAEAMAEYRHDMAQVYARLGQLQEAQATLTAHATTGRLVVSGVWLLFATVIGGVVLALFHRLVGR